MNAVARVGVAHAACLAAIHASAFGASECWSADAIASLLATPGTVALASADGAGMAMIRVVLDEAEVLTIAVHAEARRQGVGRRLLAAACEAARAQGALTLFLEVSARNAAARALYLGAGFGASGLRRGYYGDGADAVLMSRSLCGSGGS